jgi:hypothetical protein
MRNQKIVDYFKQKYGTVIPAGEDEIRICCPKCYEKTGRKDVKFHLYINTQKLAFNCFRCNFRGKTLQDFGIAEHHYEVTEPNEILKLFKQKSLSKKNICTESNDFFANGEKFDFELDDGTARAIARTVPPKSIELPDCFSTDFFRSAASTKAYQYLKSRKVTDKQIKEHKIGFCEGGRYANCIIFPVYEFGTLVYFVARSITDKRYYNAPYSSQDILFNYCQQQTMVLTEGIFDALAFGYYGVALLGKILKKGQFNKILQAPPKTLYICLDPDAKTESLKVLGLFKDYIDDVRLIKLKTGDAADTSKRRLLDYLRNARTISNEDLILLTYYE